MTEVNYEGIKAQLQTELEAVEHQLEEHGVELDGDGIEVRVDEGFADSAQATTERSEFLALVEQLRGQRADLVAALTRIDEGTYGKCENCGNAIPFERLEARPTARLCVTCAQQSG
jgi:RNA polymerase-binding protein DksA